MNGATPDPTEPARDSEGGDFQTRIAARPLLYRLVRVDSKEEAVRWALRFAEADPGTEISILELAG